MPAGQSLRQGCRPPPGPASSGSALQPKQPGPDLPNPLGRPRPQWPGVLSSPRAVPASVPALGPGQLLALCRVLLQPCCPESITPQHGGSPGCPSCPLPRGTSPPASPLGPRSPRPTAQPGSPAPSSGPARALSCTGCAAPRLPTWPGQGPCSPAQLCCPESLSPRPPKVAAPDLPTLALVSTLTCPRPQPIPCPPRAQTLTRPSASVLSQCGP